MKSKWWNNQAVVCTSDKTTLNFGQVYKIAFIVNTENMGIAFFIQGIDNSRAYSPKVFVPLLEWIEITQAVDELFYNN